MRLLPVIMILSFLLSACGNEPRIRRVLDEADRMIMTMPDSAAAMLKSLDMGGAAASERARHALLLTKALRKAHVMVTDDSLISIAAGYYRGRGDSLEVQSLFYNGAVLRYRKDYANALILLMEARDRASDTGDDFYRAMACREQASVYTALCNYDKAAELGREAAQAFYKAGHPLHAAWERVYIPQSLVYSGRAEEAYDSIKVLASDSLIHADTVLLKEFLWIASNVCFENSDYDLAEEYFDSLVSVGGIPSSKLLSQMALLKLEKSDLTGARQYHDLAVGCQQTAADTLAAVYALSRIYEAEGDHEKAYRLTVMVDEQSDPMMDTLITHPYTTLVNDYYHAETRRKTALLEDAALRIMVWISLSMTLLTIILCLVCVYRYRLRQREMEREMLRSDLARLEQQISSLSAVTPNSTSLREPDTFLLAFMKSVCDLIDVSNAGERGTEDFGIRISELISRLTDDENLKILEIYVNDKFDNLMTRFRQQAVGLSKRQFDISIFVFLGFSDSTVAWLFNKKPVANPRQLRYRIRKKLKENPVPDLELFLRYF